MTRAASLHSISDSLGHNTPSTLINKSSPHKTTTEPCKLNNLTKTTFRSLTPQKENHGRKTPQYNNNHPLRTTLPPTTTKPKTSPTPIRPKHPPNPLLKTDKPLLRLSSLLSTPSGTDAFLCTLSYTLTLLHALLTTYHTHHPTPTPTRKSSSAPPPPPPQRSLIPRLLPATKALASTISDYRIFARLWGVVGLYTWARATLLAPAPVTVKQRVQRALAWASISSCVGFQVLENGAYLASKGVLGWDVGRQNRAWVWSSRFWAVYVGVEMGRLGVEGWFWEEGGEEEKGERRWVWWKDVVSNMAYAPMTLHWSVEEGLMSEMAVGACGIVAGGANLVDAWRKTA
ncbi:hypothetical protein GQ44DRAFT_831774 [Phaeosphaeriaceae sp. PMI808]|nr:hypothetical protein GQ44DRAFT_831774 [Phaeosphaeriaceae sp. PMI808]